MSRAARYDAFGGPEVLYIADVDEVPPAAGEVAIRVAAAGLNPMDRKLRAGMVPMGEPRFPRGIGIDFAGTVESVGDGAAFADGTPVAIGDEVLGWGDGTVAERVVVPASQLARRPAGLSEDVAGSLVVAGLTALSSIRTVPVGDGDTVLVSGAAGAVGIVYAQLAIARRARVVGVAHPRHHDFLRSLKVDPVAYGEGLVERVKAHAPCGFTAVQDNHGREGVDAGLALGVPKERILAIANHNAVADLGIRTAPRLRDAEDLAWLANEVAAGRIVLPIVATFPLDEVRAAFELLESKHDPGKIVVRP